MNNPSIILRQALRAGTLAGSLDEQIILIQATDRTLSPAQFDELSEWLQSLEDAMLDEDLGEDSDEDAPTM